MNMYLSFLVHECTTFLHLRYTNIVKIVVCLTFSLSLFVPHDLGVVEQ